MGTRSATGCRSGLLVYIMVDNVTATVDPLSPMGARLCNRSAETPLRLPPASVTPAATCWACINNVDVPRSG